MTIFERAKALPVGCNAPPVAGGLILRRSL
jgi:hypothetical protein